MSLLNADGNPMRFNNLGDSGLMVSEISFGTMTFSDVDRAATGTGEGAKAEQAYEILETCYKGGVNFFDCAEGYGYAGAAERVLGEAIQIGLKKGTWDRMVRDSTLSCCPTFRRPQARRPVLNHLLAGPGHQHQAAQRRPRRPRQHQLDRPFSQASRRGHESLAGSVAA